MLTGFAGQRIGEEGIRAQPWFLVTTMIIAILQQSALRAHAENCIGQTWDFPYRVRTECRSAPVRIFKFNVFSMVNGKIMTAQCALLWRAYKKEAIRVFVGQGEGKLSSLQMATYEVVRLKQTIEFIVLANFDSSWIMYDILPWSQCWPSKPVTQPQR